MRINVLTLFPEMINNIAKESILGKAIDAGHIEINAVDIRDYANNKHNRVDDYTYGGGAGMLMQAEPVYTCFMETTGGNGRLIYVTPQGTPFNQKLAKEFAEEDEITILCGHYEGIDERVLEEIVTDYISIGDYVLTGGELAAMVITDAVARLVPEVLGNDESAEIESFHRNLLEYPQYTRPEIWHDKKVPDELLSGNPKIINPWREEKSIQRTRERRPDLYERYCLEQNVINWLNTYKRDYVFALEPLKRGQAEVVFYDDKKAVVIRDLLDKFAYVVCENGYSFEKLLKYISDCDMVSADEATATALLEATGRTSFDKYTCYVYTDKLRKSPENEEGEAEKNIRSQINKTLDRGETYYCMADYDDEKSAKLYEKLGLYPSRKDVYCIR